MTLVAIKIDGKDYEVKSGITILKACEEHAGSQIPRFCYHEKLKIAGNCRMCLVEVKPGPPKPTASCAMPVSSGMEIFTNSEMVKNARDGVMEFLLINHPLDCPVCDQAGECDLQDQAYVYGRDKTEFEEGKRAVEDKYMGPIIKTKMNRCIHCTRCIRFSEDVCGETALGAVGRGGDMEITSLEGAIKSELSGNLVDLCPVGALTAKPYKGTARQWELAKLQSIDVSNSLGASVRFDVRSGKVLRALPIQNDEINEDWICDKARFSIDGLYSQRIDSTYVLGKSGLEKSDFDEAISKACNLVKSSKKVGIITGKMTDLQTIYLAKKLADICKTEYYSCFESDVNLNTENRGNFLFNSKIIGVDEADLIVLVGVNLKKDSPVLNARIKRANLERRVKIFSIDSEKNLTYPVKFLKNSIKFLSDILDKKGEIFEALQNAKKPMIIIGEDAISGDDGQKVHDLVLKIASDAFVREDWNGFCFVPKAISAIGGLLLDFHGKRTSEILEKAKLGEIDCLILIETCDIDVSGFDECEVLSITSHGSDEIKNSKIILPSLTFAEKSSYFVNLEGRVLKSQKLCEIVDKNFDECETLCKIISSLDKDFKLKNRKDVDLELTDFIAKLRQDFLSKNKISSGKNTSEDIAIESRDYNFYMTDLISKNSKNMANCVREILKV